MLIELICLIIKFICFVSVIAYAVCMYGAAKGWFS